MLLLTGCGLVRPERADLVSEYKATVGGQFLDCGLVDLGPTCMDQAVHVSGACFVDAWSSCYAATATYTRTTAAGGEITTEWLLHPGAGDSCVLTVFEDTTLDPDAEQTRITQSSCATPEIGDGCSPVRGVDCVEVDHW